MEEAFDPEERLKAMVAAIKYKSSFESDKLAS